MKIESMLLRSLAKMAVCTNSEDREVCRCELSALLQELDMQGAGASTDVNTSARERDTNLKSTVVNIIHEIGIPAHIKGYNYATEAIIIAVNDADVINTITTKLYRMVAKKFDTTPSRVERAIRHAIETAWDNRCDFDVIQKYFGNTISYNKGKPTNSEFIAMISDHIRNNM